MGKWKHRLKDVDVVNRKATCIECGEVKVKKRQNGGWRCYNIVYIENRRSPSYGKDKHGERPLAACPICGAEEKLVWDHDHVTGKFRDYICRLCNSGLGMFDDSPDILEKAKKYLEKHKAT